MLGRLNVPQSTSGLCRRNADMMSVRTAAVAVAVQAMTGTPGNAARHDVRAR